MFKSVPVLLAFLTAGLGSGIASAQSFEAEVTPLVESSCLRCHGPRTTTPLDLSELGYDLSDHDTFRAWEKVYTRVSRGEMPPAVAPQPDAAVAETALTSLKVALVEASLNARGGQRTPLRRMTRLEYGYTMRDLLGLDDALRQDLEELLPGEPDAGSFDVVAAKQGISPLHVRSYLDAADRALDLALMLGTRPATERYTIDYAKSQRLARIAESKAQGGGGVLKLDDGFATFTQVGSTYMLHSASEGFGVSTPGRYRITVDAYPYQVHRADKPVTLTLYRQEKYAQGTASLDQLIGSFDLVGESPQTVEITPFLRPGDLIAPSVADLVEPLGDPAVPYLLAGKNVRDYTGEGIALRSMAFEGPLYDNDIWPPLSTRQLLTGVDFDEAGEIRLSKDPYAHVVEIVDTFATRAFRRPLHDGELEAYTSLAKSVLAEGRPFLEAVRVPLRAILSAPAFLYQSGDPGALDDYALASRLSYFLWRSMPDDQLFDLAGGRRLSDPTVLSTEGRPDARRPEERAVRRGLRGASVSALRDQGDHPRPRALSGIRRPAGAGDGARD